MKLLRIKQNSLTHKAVSRGVDSLTICGDNGTSLLYSSTIACSIILRYFGSLNSNQILGVTSLIIWTAIPTFVLYMFGLVYLTDLEEKIEGGSPAFLLLIRQLKKKPVAISTSLTTIVLIMMALTIPDFWLTGAISLLAAFGGLKIIVPNLPQYWVWIPACVVAWLFFGPLMRQGIGKINKFFGPITLVWFILVSVFSVISIVQNPNCLRAFNPVFGVLLIKSLPVGLVLSLFGALILIITGWEAAQLDRKDYLLKIEGPLNVLPIQLAFGLNTITNILSVLAQCSFALRLVSGAAIIEGVTSNPVNQTFTVTEELPNLFFGSLPSHGFVLFMVGYAVVEVIIAATATTLGAQNLFAELHGLGLWFRMERIFTNKLNSHEFYVRSICESLKYGCIALMVIAQSDERLASAYGTSVVCGMFVGSYLASQLAPYAIEYSNIPSKTKIWFKWIVKIFFGVFVIFFIPYLFGGISKIFEGSWITLLGAGVFYLFLDAYQWGEQKVTSALNSQTMTVADLYERYETSNRTGILLVKPGAELDEETDNVPVFLQKYAMKHGVVPQKLVSISISLDSVPNKKAGRFKLVETRSQNHTLYCISANYGWADEVNIHDAIAYANKKLHFNLLHDSILITGKVYLQSRKRTTIHNKVRYSLYQLIRGNFAHPFHEWVGIKNPDNIVKVNFTTHI